MVAPFAPRALAERAIGPVVVIHRREPVAMTDQLQCEGALRLLVARLDAGFLEDPESGNWLIRLDGVDDEGGNLGLKPLDTHPVEALAGFVAPADWFAVGIASDG